MFLKEHFHLNWDQMPPISFFIEIGQEYLLFDWLDLNLPVSDRDLNCLSEERNRKVFTKSQLMRDDLSRLTKGQFMLFYSVLIDEIGSFVSLVRNDSIENKLFGFGMYTNLLHFSIVMTRVSLSKWIVTHCPKHFENSSSSDKISITEVAVLSNSYPIFKYITDFIAGIDKWKVRNPERLLKLASLSMNDEIRTWEKHINLKYEFLSICAIREESVFSARQMNFYLEQIIRLGDKLFPYEWGSIDSFDKKLFSCLQDVLNGHNIQYKEMLQMDAWFSCVGTLDWDDIMALILATSIYNQWLDLIYYFVNSMKAKCFLENNLSWAFKTVESIFSGCIKIIDGNSNTILSFNALNLIVTELQDIRRLEDERFKDPMIDEAHALHDRLKVLIGELVPINKLEEVIEMQKNCEKKAFKESSYLMGLYVFPQSFQSKGYRSLFSYAITMRSTSYLQWFLKVLPRVSDEYSNKTLLGGLLGEAAYTGQIELVYTILSAIKQNVDMDAIGCVFRIMTGLFLTKYYDLEGYNYSYKEKCEADFDFNQRCEMFVILADEVVKMGAVVKGSQWNNFGWTFIKALEDLNIHYCPSKPEDLEKFKFSLMGIDFIIKNGYIDMNALIITNNNHHQELVECIFTNGTTISNSTIKDSTEFILKLYFQQKFNLFKLFVDNGWDFMAYCNICLKRLNNIFWMNLNIDNFYDNETGYPYTLQYLEYMLQKFDINIQLLNDIRTDNDTNTYDPNSKQFKAIKY